MIYLTKSEISKGRGDERQNFAPQKQEVSMNGRKMVSVLTSLLVIASMAFAEDSAINPVRVATRQINGYGDYPYQIHGTNMTASAAELNVLDGYTGTTANLNSGLAASTATLVSNATLKVYLQNFAMVTGGTFAAPQGVIASSNLVGRTEIGASVSMSIATNANGGTNVCTFTVKDLAGTAMADQCAFRFFISDAVSGAPSAVAGDVIMSNSAEIQQVVDKADYWIFSTLSNGTAVATITDTPGSTNYIHAVAPGGKISRAQSQFNVP